MHSHEILPAVMQDKQILRVHWNGDILPAGFAEDASSDRTYYAVVKPRDPASTSSTLDQVDSQELSTMPVYQACLLSQSTGPFYHACLPCLSSMPVYHACLPCLPTMPV